MYDTSRAPPCQSIDEANATIVRLSQIIFDFSSDPLGCLPPCNQTLFNLEYTTFFKNSELVVLVKNGTDDNEGDDSELTVSVFYRTLLVEEHTETVLYDAVNFLSAAGGNLGLLLGFSCLSTLLYLYDLILNKVLSKGVRF